MTAESFDNAFAFFATRRQLLDRTAWMLREAAELYTLYICHLLSSFSGQRVKASEIFNLDAGILRLPKFNKVERRYWLVIEDESIKFDVLAEGNEIWLVKVAYQNTPVSLGDVEEFVLELSKLDGWQMPLPAGKRLWFFSRSGFDAEAAARLRKLNILHCDIFGFNTLCRTVKIGEVPVGG